jgi:hypothetical protein
MQVQATTGLWEILFWIVAGSGLLGLPPGERDQALIKAVPAQSVLYFEWAARGPGQAGAAGVDGFAADPEIIQFTQLLDAALAKPAAAESHEDDDPDSLQRLRPLAPQLVKLLTAHPGCAFASFAPARPNNFGGLNLLSALTSVQAGIILSSGSDTDALWKTLNEALTSIPEFRYDEKALTQSIPISLPGYKLILHREGPRILFALGDTTLPRMIDGLSGRQPGLDSNPRFKNSFDRIATPRFSSVGWVDGNGLISGVTSSLGPVGMLFRPILNAVGVDALDHLVQTSGVDRETMIQRTFLSTGGRTDGILVLAAGTPIQPEQFSHIPADADLVVATSLSLTGVFQETRQMLEKAQPLSVRVFDEAVKQLQSELELKIVEDVLPAFGDVIMAFDSPTEGGLIATSLVVSLEVKDRAKAAIVFERVMKLIEQSIASDHTELDYGETATLRRQTFLGSTICYVHSTGHPGNFPMTPSFCLTDRHLLFAVHPQAMKAHLRFLQSKRPGFDQQASKKVFVPVGQPLTYTYLDGARAGQAVAMLLPYFGPAILGRLSDEGVSLDAFAIPSAAALTPYIGDSTAIVMRQADGLLIETRNAPTVVAMLSLLSIYRAWNTHEFELMEVGRRARAGDADQAQLGPVENQVVPAVAEKPQPNPPKAAQAEPSPYRKLAPIFLKALIPENLQQMIPDSALRELEKGPSPAAIERRDEARRKREERRQQRQRPLPPTPRP